MATLGVLRKNIDTGEMEHFVANGDYVQFIPPRDQIKNVRVIPSDNNIKMLLINDQIKIPGYWAPFLGDIVPNPDYDQFEQNDNIKYITFDNGLLQKRNSDIRTSESGKKYILEEITDGDITSYLEKDLYPNEDYTDVIDVSIWELLPAKKGLPVYTKQPTEGLIPAADEFDINESGLNYNKTDNLIEVDNGNYTIYVLKDFDITFDAKVLDPITGARKGLEAEWFKDDKSIQKIYNESIVSYKLDTPSDEHEGQWVCRTSNRVGSTDSNRFALIVEDLTKIPIFNKNLIKNGDFNNSFSNWDIIEGDPKIEYEWDSITASNKSTNILIEQSFIPSDEDQRKFAEGDSYAKIKGPALSDIFNVKRDFSFQKHDIIHFLNGGVMDDNENALVRLKQTIDLSDYSHWVDGKVNGVRGLYGSLFAWLGGQGTQAAFNSPDLNKVQLYDLPYEDIEQTQVKTDFKDWRLWMAQKPGDKGYYSLTYPHDIVIGDRVMIVLKMYDAANNLIDNRYRLVNPTHKYSEVRMYLRQQDVYIPKGTRTIDVEVIFEKQRYYDIVNFNKSDDRSILNEENNDLLFNLFLKNLSDYYVEKQDSSINTFYNYIADEYLNDITGGWEQFEEMNIKFQKYYNYINGIDTLDYESEGFLPLDFDAVDYSALKYEEIKQTGVIKQRRTTQSQTGTTSTNNTQTQITTEPPTVIKQRR